MVQVNGFQNPGLAFQRPAAAGLNGFQRQGMDQRKKGQILRPDQIASVAAWWDAGDPKDFVLAAGNVTSWRDRIGGRVATNQAETSNQAIPYSATSFNGAFPGVSFGGGNRLQHPAFAGLPSEESWIFAVGHSNTSGAGTLYNYMLEFGSGTDGRLLAGDKTAPFGVAMGSEGGGPLPVGTTSIVGANVLAAGRITLTKGSEAWRDGTRESVALGSTVAVAAGGGVGIGGPSWINTAYFTGVLSSLVIAGPLTDAERQGMEGYLAQTYGIANKLPTGHPFKV